MKSGTNPKKILRVSALVLADILSVNLAAFLSLYSRFEFSLSALIQSGYLDQLARFAVIGTALTLIIFFLMRPAFFSERKTYLTPEGLEGRAYHCFPCCTKAKWIGAERTPAKFYLLLDAMRTF